MTLLEKYKKRLSISEGLYAKYNNGAVIPMDRKIITAQILENQNKYLTETYGDQSVSTQRSDIGMMKKFVMDVATLALPNFIAPDLVLTKPIDNFNGYITYYEYSKASNKGESSVGDMIVNPFKNGKVDPNYTSQTVIENVTLAADNKTLALKWDPIIPGTIEFSIGDDTFFDGGDGVIYKGTFASKVFTAEKKDANGHIEGQAGRFIVDAGDAEAVGTVTYGYKKAKSVTGNIYDEEPAAIVFTAALVGVTTPVKVNYLYNNIAINQHEIPYITVQQKGIYVTCEARKIAIEYSQMAAYQYKKEYGENLGARLEQVAIHTLKYETDVEVTNLLVNNARLDESLTFNITVPTGISLSQHFAGFARKVLQGQQKVYEATQKFTPNYMLAGTEFMSILPLCDGFKQAANLASVNGPYYFGTYNGMKVYITPNMPADRYVLGVNGNDLGTSAAVWAPFLAITPTASLETPDGTNTKGYSSVYALQLLNKDLLIAGKIVELPQAITITAAQA